MTKKRENVPYQSLPGTVLVDVEVSRCPNCGEFEVAIPAIEELDRVLANAVIRKPTRLTGLEVKFLRKYLGYSGTDFAKLIGADKATVSRWEKDAQPIGQQTDRLYRTLVILDKKIEEYPIANLAELDEGTAAKPHYAFSPTSKKLWKAAELAA
jgi:putative zinc finger/helix-turn-helix YgiT family protein